MSQPDSPNAQSWIEVSAAAIRHNVQTFRRLAGETSALMAVVKANAYGHGMELVAQTASAAGATWLGVFSIDEALRLRRVGVATSILVLGPTPRQALREAIAAKIHVTIADPEAADAALAAAPHGLCAHLKLETGTHRQGLRGVDLAVAKRLLAGGVTIAGAYSHFADIEDTTDHTFAHAQLEEFRTLTAALASLGAKPAVVHVACSAAALLFPETTFDMVRTGIGLYGLWPSKETLVSVRENGREPVRLEPVMTWKTRLTELKWAEPGVTVGYGRTFKTTRRTLLGILPVGYANGYDRRLSNSAHVLVHGQRAKVVGRVMMNMTIVDVTDVGGATVGDEVVLLGSQQSERITAEHLASWIGTINYEVVTRAEPHGPRRLV
jgi:alanine racemase